MNQEEAKKHVFDMWHAGAKGRDVEKLMSVYADDAVLETPAILAVWRDREEGILRGKEEITRFFQESFLKAQSALAKDFGGWWRTGDYYSKDELLMWEYPRLTPNGPQVDLVESMDIENGLIKYHRVYWGWKGFKVLASAITR